MATLTDKLAVVTVGRDDALAPFSAAEKMAAKAHHVEPYRWVHFHATEGSDEGFFEASNGHNSIRSKVSGLDVSQDIDCYLPRRLGSVLKSMPAGPVQLEIGNEMTVHGPTIGDTSYTLGLLGEHPKDYPLDCGQDVDWGTARYLDQQLIEALQEAARFVSWDNARQNLMSVLVKQGDNQVTVASSDSYRMYVVRGVDAIDFGMGQFTLPAAAISEMGRSFAGSFKISWDDNKVFLSDEDTTYFSTRRIHGDVPDFEDMVERITSSDQKIVLPLPRQELLNAINQVSVMGAGKGQPVALDLQEDAIEVALQSDDGRAKSVVPATLTELDADKKHRVGFNLDFLRDGLDLMDEDELEAHYINPVRPVVLQSSDGSKSYMIAPVRI